MKPAQSTHSSVASPEPALEARDDLGEGLVVTIRQVRSLSTTKTPTRGGSVFLRLSLAVLVLLASVQTMAGESGRQELAGGDPSPVGLDEHARSGVGIGLGWVSDGASDTLRRAVSLLPFLAGLASVASATDTRGLARLVVWRARGPEILTFGRLRSRGPPAFASLS